VLGFILVYSTERVLLDPRWRLLIAIGFCGSYTTFSSYAFESFALMEQGQMASHGSQCFGEQLALPGCGAGGRCSGSRAVK